MSGLHPCPAAGCTRHLSFDVLACSRHWYQLPQKLRNAIWAAWRSGDLAQLVSLRAEAVEFWATATAEATS